MASRRLRQLLWGGVALVAILAALVLLFDGRRLHKLELPGTADLDAVKRRLVPDLDKRLAAHGNKRGNPVFIRIFKESAELEVWIAGAPGEPHKLFKTYPICAYSGGLGPKLQEGDRQSPEGFYRVSRQQLNPQSNYHLSFNLGFPNAYDRHHGRTGSFLMVHGNCSSIGCYAMTNAGIEEIYLLVEAALAAGQPYVPVHAFPFRLTPANLQRHAASPWQGFWRQLQSGYDAFETRRIPPTVTAEAGAYVVRH